MSAQSAGSAPAASGHGDAHGHGPAGDHGHGHAHEHPVYHLHHFDTPDQQFSSSKLGMWVFLVTEVLFFGGLFCAYTVYRANHPEIYDFAHTYLNKTMGAINTVVLLFSSLTMAWAVRCAQIGARRGLIIALSLTMACAYGFMIVKTFEYHHKYMIGTLPGAAYDPTELPPGVEVRPDGTHVHSHGHDAHGGHGHDAKAGHGGKDAHHEHHDKVVSFSLFGVRLVHMNLLPFCLLSLAAVAALQVATILYGRQLLTWYRNLSFGQGAGIAAGAVAVLLVVCLSLKGTLTDHDAAHPDPAHAKAEAPKPAELPPGTPKPLSMPEMQDLNQKVRSVGIFFSIYFCMTGLHGIHVAIGIGLIGWLLLRAIHGDFGPKYFTPVDLIGLYWHIVDLIWIYLFPLLYLIR